MKQKISTIINISLVIFTAGSFILGLLAWFDIPPPKEQTNAIYRILLSKVSIFWIAFVGLAVFITTRFFLKRSKKAFNGVKTAPVGLKKTPKRTEQKEKVELTTEHYWVLFKLLNESTKAYYQYEMESEFQEKFNARIADFNIVKGDLLEEKLITEEVGMNGNLLELTQRGLKLIGEEYKRFSTKKT